MALDIAGTPLEFSVDGIVYRLAADVNITEIITEYENAMIPTTGKAMLKMTKRVPAREGFVVIANGQEREDLKSKAEGIDLIQFSYTNAAGDSYKCQGQMEIENAETEENRVTINVFPVENWTAFLGG